MGALAPAIFGNFITIIYQPGSAPTMEKNLLTLSTPNMLSKTRPYSLLEIFSKFRIKS